MSERNSRGNARKRVAWARSGKLISGDDSRSVSLQYTFETPGVHTIQFNMIVPTLKPAVPHTAVIKAEALVTWETNGCTVTRRLSIGDGTTIQGVGESVKVVMYDTTDLGDSAPSPDDLGIVYAVSAACSPGTRGSFTNPPVLSENNVAVVVTAGNSAFVSVPADAGANSVCVSVGSPNGLPILDNVPQVKQLLGGTGSAVLQWYDPRNFAFAPIAPGVRTVELRNTSLTGQALYFSVTWGIDG